MPQKKLQIAPLAFLHGASPPRTLALKSMKLPILPTVLFVGLASSLAANAAAILVSDKIVKIASSTTQNYTFTSGGDSITLQAVFTPTLNGAASPTNAFHFSSLDSGTHVGNDAIDSGSHFSYDYTGNGTDKYEGFNVTISLLNATPGVDTSSIQFQINSIGVRVLSASAGSNASFSWNSSATTTPFTTSNSTSEALRTLDTNFYSGIATTSYVGSWQMASDGAASGTDYIQLSDVVTGSNGINMTAMFNVVPEPSALLALMGGTGVLVGLRRRRC
jgi:hypothetical protein